MKDKDFEVFQNNMFNSISDGLEDVYKKAGLNAVRTQVKRLFESTSHINHESLTRPQLSTLRRNLRGYLAEQSCYYEVLCYDGLKKGTGQILSGRIFKLPNNDTTEVDLIYITNYKIFVIEIKAIFGSLSIGKEGDIISSDSQFQTNPFKQNEYHINKLQSLLSETLLINSPYFFENIVYIYSNSNVTEDKRTDLLKQQSYVANFHLLQKTLHKLDNRAGKLSLNSKEVYDKLNKIGKLPTLSNRLKHISNQQVKQLNNN